VTPPDPGPAGRAARDEPPHTAGRAARDERVETSEHAGTSGTTSLGADWTVGEDGVRYRRAARVVVLDGTGRVLVMRGHDRDQPERSWWFTVGGGIDAGETDVEAAVRELHEETGIVLSGADLQGPVLTRSAMFHFLRESCRQDEVFFLARVDGVGGTPDQEGWTDTERELLDELRWLTPAELRAETREIYPENLADLVETWSAGWDGEVVHLGDSYE